MQPKNKSWATGAAFGFLKPLVSMTVLVLGILGVFNNAWPSVNGYDVTGSIDSFTNNSLIQSTAGNGLDITNTGDIGTLTNNGTISSDSEAGVNNSGTIGTLTNSSTGTIEGATVGVKNNITGTIGSLINSRTISGRASHGIENFGTISTLTNSGMGTISGSPFGISNALLGTIGTLTNTTTISGVLIGIFSSGTIGTLTNTGTITSTFHHGIYNRGTITTLSNSVTGAISSGDNGIFNDGGGIITTFINNGRFSGTSGAGIKNSGIIGTLTNNGAFSSDSGAGVNNSRTIGTLTNSGTISNGIWNAGFIGLINNSNVMSGDNQAVLNTGSIFELVNTGTIVGTSTGIQNSWLITTLHNQEGSNGSLPLTYSGILPTKYRILIAGTTTFGRLSAGSVTGVTEFGVSRFSTTSPSIINMTFADVLIGITPANLGLGSATTVSDTSNGYSYTLTQTDLVSKSWSLTITACRDCFVTYITTGMTVGLSEISATPVLLGGTLALVNGDSSGTAFDVASTSSIQSPTPGSATLSGVFSGAGGLTFIGTGTTIFTGANTYSGGTTVSSGTLQGNTSSLQGAIVNNSQVVFDQATDGAYSGAISGTGSLTKQNAGTLILTGANTYSGGTTVSAGTLQGNTTSLQGAIINNGRVVFDQPSTGTFSGTIAGSGSVVLQNAGTLVLTGANTYSGGTTVSGGTLSISGQSPTGTGDVFIGSGARLMGRGVIAGRLTVAGILSPGNSPGYLSTNATFTMSTGSTYLQDIAGTTQASSTAPVGAAGYYSFINVASGQFVIQTGATLTPRLFNLFTVNQSGYGSATYVPALGDQFRMATAQSGISGRFSTLTQPAELSSGTQLLPFYNMMGSNSLDLAVIPSSYVNTITAASGNTNAQAVGSVLTQSAQNSLAGQATEAQEQLLYSISQLTNAQSIASVAQSLAGEVYAATVAVIAQTTQRVQQTVLSRLGDTTGLGTPGALMNPNASVGINASSLGSVPTSAVSSNPNVNPNAEVKTLSNGNVWGDLAYQRGNRASDSQSGGWNSNLYQLTFGSDFYSSNGRTLGGGFALSSTTINPVYGSATVQQGSLFAYGKLPVDALVVDAMASIGLSSSDITRGDITGLSNGFKNKTVMGNDALISLGLSRPFELESMRVTPYARVTWQIATQSAVNEGGAASALNVDRYTGNGVRGVIGVAAGSLNKNPLKDGYTYRANIGVGADTAGLLNPTVNTTLIGYTSNVTTPNAGAAFVQAGLYGTAKIADNAFAYAGVSAEARTGQTLYGGNVGLRIAF